MTAWKDTQNERLSEWLRSSVASGMFTGSSPVSFSKRYLKQKAIQEDEPSRVTNRVVEKAR